MFPNLLRHPTFLLLAGTALSRCDWIPSIVNHRRPLAENPVRRAGQEVRE
ncbi:MAG: hypothetical protein AAF604_14535 [Acidobacteriota bacterium]